ncbi:inosine-uridine nucleoside N-ribohydrolase [Endobacter medicaginis]|uniref:Inosine-uridine nucleoside N-ribohydrolase n=1 Tax=Endobacter medicaginis TaxID=1181271 RepID=A0A850NSL4_9PROT|nr:nucleoside hydrolase [Endobacter medicaginis]MBB3174902.1 inosine-uridine nucleoside N-ribohydrolase [Endobacter medicaginis]MCX5475865.1 nucleoside hydrolase [Endobacter medicaginis]NVN30382.1 nucleoside hydrolase [Endobacter medicaginis]
MRPIIPLLMALLAGASIAARAADTPPARLVILDDDGFSLAQWMVLKAKDVTVLGECTVSGDVWQKEATAQALRGLEIAGRTDVKVYPGATYPLLNSEKLTDRWEALYGKLTWRGAWMKQWVEPTKQKLPPYHGPDVVPDLPQGNPHTRPADESAAAFMIRMVHRYPGQVSIVETGPMTNLALAQKLDPQFASLAKELVYMGGSLNPRRVLASPESADFAREFANSPRREFNIRFDPEAASITMRAPWRRIVMVPVDPSTATEMSDALVKRLSAADTPIARALRGPASHFPLWDEITTAVWLDPSLITGSHELYIDTNTAFSAGYGDILSWTPGYQPDLDEQREQVVLSVDVGRLETLMVGLVSRP